MQYQLTYAGVPFVLDEAKVFRLPPPDVPHGQDESQTAVRKQQPLVDLIDEVDRLISFKYLQDFGPYGSYLGRNLGAIARNEPEAGMPSPDLRINDYYYPYGASRWSVFRGLATSSLAKAMLAATGGSLPGQFVMRMSPLSPSNPNNLAAPYTVTTNLYMLPPRPLAEHGGRFDGLYLVTLVDERYYWQWTSSSLRVNQDSTWAGLINQVAADLGITLSLNVPGVYARPEPDSQLWTNFEDSSTLLDALAHNVGCVVVRNYDGTYSLKTPLESAAVALANRGKASAVVRQAGGDLFSSGTQLPVGSLFKAKNAVVPDSVSVTFPKYVHGDDPVPHYLNPRYANQRPSAWYEESYGDVYVVDTPLASGPVVSGTQFSGFVASGTMITSGLHGTSGSMTVRDTAKALYLTEASAVSGGTPVNASGLTALAMQIAQNYYASQVAVALDEVYPGILKLTPEGTHDVVWTYSARQRQATTRVLRTEWNRYVPDLQHSAPALSGYTNTPKGVGGPAVAQTIKDSFSGVVATTLAATLNPGDTTASFNSANNFPTQNRWRGRVENEVLLFEGTSGTTSVGVVYHGIDGTLPATHTTGAAVSWVTPDANYGNNLVTYEKNQFVFPGAWTSGGIQELKVIPQEQSVRVLTDTPVTINGAPHYQGAVSLFDATVSRFGALMEGVWVVDRNFQPLNSGKYYDGNLAGFSVSPVQPIYIVNEYPTRKCELTEFSEDDLRCEAGLLNRYRRLVVLGLFNGCPQVTTTPWDFIDTEGCCGCSSSSSRSSASSSSQSCQPGTCNYCACPPFQWTATIPDIRPNPPFVGCGGLVTLDNSDNCTWCATCSCGLDCKFKMCLIIQNGYAEFTVSSASLAPDPHIIYAAKFPNGVSCCNPIVLDKQQAPDNWPETLEFDPVCCCSSSSISSVSSISSTSSLSSDSGVSTACCPGVNIPSQLFATFSGGTGTCTCLNGTTVQLDFNGIDWEGTYSGCGMPSSTLKFSCFIGSLGILGFNLSNIPNGGVGACSWPGSSVDPLSASTCGPPLKAYFNMGPESSCCNGNGVWTVTP